MRNIKQKFESYVKGSNELHLWKISIEKDFARGKKVNKTKFNKICRLYDERRSKAVELLEIINSNSPRVKHCMPPLLPPPPPPPRQPTGRNN